MAAEDLTSALACGQEWSRAAMSHDTFRLVTCMPAVNFLPIILAADCISNCETHTCKARMGAGRAHSELSSCWKLSLRAVSLGGMKQILYKEAQTRELACTSSQTVLQLIVNQAVNDAPQDSSLRELSASRPYIPRTFLSSMCNEVEGMCHPFFEKNACVALSRTDSPRRWTTLSPHVDIQTNILKCSSDLTSMCIYTRGPVDRSITISTVKGRLVYCE